MAKGLLELSVANYRCLRDVTVSLGRLNVLVGPNGSGKSTLLDVIQFLGDSVRTDLLPALDQRSGFERLCHRGTPPTRGKNGKSSKVRNFRKSPVVRIGMKAVVTKFASDNAQDEYELRFSRLAKGRIKRSESFRFKRTQGRGWRITIEGAKVTYEDDKETPKQLELLGDESLGLSTLPRLSTERGGSQVKRIAELFSSFRVFEVSVDAARRPSATDQGGSLMPDASNLGAFLAQLKDDETRFSRLQSDAREMIPGLEEIQFRHVGGAKEAVVVELVEQGLTGATPLADASYGTVRALSLLALLYDPKPPLLTCVEEIDHGLHPHVFDLLVDRLREASKRTQFLIATHSPALVNRLRASELIVCEKDTEAGASRIPAIPCAEVADMIEAGGLGLGELWFSGTLGGVP